MVQLVHNTAGFASSALQARFKAAQTLLKLFKVEELKVASSTASHIDHLNKLVGGIVNAPQPKVVSDLVQCANSAAKVREQQLSSAQLNSAVPAVFHFTAPRLGKVPGHARDGCVHQYLAELAVQSV